MPGYDYNPPKPRTVDVTDEPTARMPEMVMTVDRNGNPIAVPVAEWAESATQPARGEAKSGKTDKPGRAFMAGILEGVKPRVTDTVVQRARPERTGYDPQHDPRRGLSVVPGQGVYTEAGRGIAAGAVGPGSREEREYGPFHTVRRGIGEQMIQAAPAQSEILSEADLALQEERRRRAMGIQ